MTAPYYVTPNFVDFADEMRACFERHFAEPHKTAERHQTWTYWYVPETYTYLLTNPEKVIERPLVERFVKALRAHALENLGIHYVTWPRLSLYVDGCGQEMHNDSVAGSFGFVYSLTRWDERRFKGGETRLYREQDYWGSGTFRKAQAGASFFELVPARFNQLLIFDDRVIHAVPRIEGVMDPLEGRVVLHGHMTARDMVARGGLAGKNQVAGMDKILERVQDICKPQAGRFHGCATFALDVAPDGEVRNARVLVDRLLTNEGPGQAAEMLERICADARNVRLEAAEQPSRITFPVVFQ